METVLRIALALLSSICLHSLTHVEGSGCEDAIPHCSHYGPASCAGPYEAWARKNCMAYCHFCDGKSTPAPPCRDMADDCDTYLQTACTDPQYKTWAHEKCRYYCRLCPVPVLSMVDSSTTTIKPKNCVDKLDCKLFGKSSCGGNFTFWAKTNCPAFCEFCTPPPTPPRPCHDLVPNCDKYVTEICEDHMYLPWSQTNCRKFCKFCKI